MRYKIYAGKTNFSKLIDAILLGWYFNLVAFSCIADIVFLLIKKQLFKALEIFTKESDNSLAILWMVVLVGMYIQSLDKFKQNLQSDKFFCYFFVKTFHKNYFFKFCLIIKGAIKFFLKSFSFVLPYLSTTV